MIFDRINAILISSFTIFVSVFLSYVFKMSYLFPFSYLDTGMVISGYYRAYQGTNGYSFILLIVIITFYAAVFNYLSDRVLKNIRRKY